MEKVLNIQTDSYKTVFYKLEPSLFYSQRVHHWKTPVQHIDVISNCWNVVFGNYHQGDLSFINNNQRDTFDGIWAFVIPPFSILHWQINTSPLRWQSYTLLENNIENFPYKPIAFKLDEIPILQSSRDIQVFISTIPDDILNLEKNDKASALAIKTKKLLDNTFRDDFPIAEIAKKLNCSHSVMSRYFKNNYAISVIKYRNQLRLFDSLLNLLTNNNKVNEAAQHAGNKDLSKFYRRFKNFFRTSPSSYSPRNTR
ncbi:MAG: helix-turn-helix transcriptional regulator [Bdellovibrionales bacterium]|nr:helix-turn-helix transcriptional regulator [Bdellovibrionales bacterium]